ncbi:MAG: glycoside hydrolase family 9 protein, partial [Bacteroidota bacterium]
RFVLCTSGSGVSRPFVIGDSIHSTVALAVLKGFYFQRMSVSLPERYAGPWHRSAGHPDHIVYVHPSAASAERPAGTVISSPGGWYDAGDYNKYMVNSGITTATLLSLFEDYPGQLTYCKTNIPESGNSLPDLLDEICWNLRWMLTMQDPYDGGVYHKCTTAEFEGFIRPELAADRRYVVQKSTAAALNFAAVTAQAARVFATSPGNWAGLADSCREASARAWAWAVAHPDVIYDQTRLNVAFDPDINTGSYGDGELNDEWLWAGTELYITTSDESYLRPGVFPPVS